MLSACARRIAPTLALKVRLYSSGTSGVLAALAQAARKVAITAHERRCQQLRANPAVALTLSPPPSDKKHQRDSLDKQAAEFDRRGPSY